MEVWLGTVSLGTLASELWLGALVRDLALGILSLGIFPWDLSLGELGLGRLGQPRQRSRGDLGGRFRLSGDEEAEKEPL